MTPAEPWDGQDYDEMDRCGVCYELALAVQRTPHGERWRCLACGATRAQNYAAYLRRHFWRRVS
jgi:hypothetical protein